jgi:catechol 2,3-dioxygenase-like lactoylglutathione lyase family enzyme
MFKSARPFGSFSVNDLDKAKEFYHTILGLEVQPKISDEGVKLLELQIGGGSKIIAYCKDDHEPAKFTILNFPVKDVEEVVDEMSSGGIKFEHYDSKQLKTDNKGISRGAGPTIAWFRDPAGNILSVTEENKMQNDD